MRVQMEGGVPGGEATAAALPEGATAPERWVPSMLDGGLGGVPLGRSLGEPQCAGAAAIADVTLALLTPSCGTVVALL